MCVWGAGTREVEVEVKWSGLRNGIRRAHMDGCWEEARGYVRTTTYDGFVLLQWSFRLLTTEAHVEWSFIHPSESAQPWTDCRFPHRCGRPGCAPVTQKQAIACKHPNTSPSPSPSPWCITHVAPPRMSSLRACGGHQHATVVRRPSPVHRSATSRGRQQRRNASGLDRECASVALARPILRGVS